MIAPSRVDSRVITQVENHDHHISSVLRVSQLLSMSSVSNHHLRPQALVSTRSHSNSGGST
jgi:hypothetical protein